MHDLQKTESNLLTNEHLSRISPYPQANELNCFDSGWTSLCNPSRKCSPAQTLNGLTCSLLQHAFLRLQFLCYSWMNSISGNLSLPLFTSLFRLTEASLRILFISSSTSLTIRKDLRNFQGYISMKLGLAEPQSWRMAESVSISVNVLHRQPGQGPNSRGVWVLERARQPFTQSIFLNSVSLL